MARVFNGSNQYLTNEQPVLKTVPLTMSAWFKPYSVAINQVICAIGGDDGATAHCWEISLISAAFRAATSQNTSEIASIANAATANVWHHGCGVFKNNNTRTAILNGVLKATDTGVKTPDPAYVERMRVGLRTDAWAAYFSGAIADFGLWDVALLDNEVAMLAAGYPPTSVRPDRLRVYLPLLVDGEPDIDTVGLKLFTPVNAPTLGPDPVQLGFHADPMVETRDPRKKNPRGKPKKPPKNPPTPPEVTLLTVALDALTLAGSVASLAVDLSIDIALDALTLASSVTSFVLTNIKRASKKAGWPFWRF